MEKIKEHYNKIYTENEVAFGGGKVENIVKDILKYKQEGSVLEIGAGEGRNSLFLATEGFDVEAMDVSDRGIAKLQESADTKGLKIKTHVADITLFTPERSYDVIVSTFVAHHQSRGEALAIIQLIKDQTNPNGLNVIAVFTKDGDFYRNNPETDRFYPDLGELSRLYSDWEVLEYSEEEGKALQKKVDGSPMLNIVARILARKPTSP